MAITVVFEDKVIVKDGLSLIIEDFSITEGHESYHAIYWENSIGEIQLLDGSPNIKLEGDEDFQKYVKSYSDQWDVQREKNLKTEAQQKAAQEAYYNSLEQRWYRLRKRRDKRLYETDYILMPDYSVTEACKEAFLEYRQALRDLTSLEGAPWTDDTVPWPTKPEVVKA